MAIVVNNPGDTRTVDTSGSDAASWMVALAVIIILAIGAFYLLPRIAGRAAPAPTPSTNINVTLPAGASGGASNPGAGGTGGTGGAGGATQ